MGIHSDGTPAHRHERKNRIGRTPGGGHTGRAYTWGAITATFIRLHGSAIGKPRAARAVANACASNHVAVAVLIPCHRVIRGDGGLGGYKWGLERKRTLLDEHTSRRVQAT